MSSKLIIGKLSEVDLYDKKIILLDDLLKDRINKEAINYKTFSYASLNLDERYKIFCYLDNLSEKIILEIKENLNTLHNVDFDIDDWKIIIGPWLNNFLKLTYNRFYKVLGALKDNDISEITIFNCEDECFTPIDNMQLNMLSNNADWNAVMYSKIISFLKPSVEIKIQDLNLNFPRNNNNSLKSTFKRYLSYFLSFLTKKNDALIVNSYLPVIESLKLHIYLKQFPAIWMPLKITNKLYNGELRKQIVLNNSNDDFEMFVKEMIPIALPTCHLESFSKLKKIINNLQLPHSPKFIFTSNNYEFDEVFKLYVVLKKKMKTTYIIGQHGNYLPLIDNVFFKKSHAADHYLDWGKNGFGISHDGFNLKLINKNIKNNKNGNILILDTPYGTNNKIYNRIDENIVKEKFLHNFLLSIDKSLHKKIILKLHLTYKERDRDYISRIKSICPLIKIETDTSTIFDLYANSRCVVHTYDSSGIYESMGLNIPTFCMWSNELNHIQYKYHKFYEALENNGILFFVL